MTTVKQKNSLVIVCAISLGLMAYSGYIHIDGLPSEAEALSFSFVVSIWPIFILMISFLLFVLGLVLSRRSRPIASRIVGLAGLVGLVYYLIALYALFSMMSIVMFFIPVLLLAYVVPAVFMIWLVPFSIRIGRSKA